MTSERWSFSSIFPWLNDDKPQQCSWNVYINIWILSTSFEWNALCRGWLCSDNAGVRYAVLCDVTIRTISSVVSPEFALTWYSSQWRHNGHDDVANHQPHDCLLNRLVRRISKKTSKLRVTGIREEDSPMTGEFPTQRASNAENVSIWWRHHEIGSIHPSTTISL